ncbi:hypothetical protein L842_0525 [Mycobacterium intracellulare MIN_052511_1280]|nr:hypothetical protein L842_0525 [Mycobacterium intracellulare MIN_052511_1280]
MLRRYIHALPLAIHLMMKATQGEFSARGFGFGMMFLDVPNAG